MNATASTRTAHSNRPATTSLTRMATGFGGLLLMTFGPLLTVIAAHNVPAWDEALLHAGGYVALIMWIPFNPLSLSALLLQDERDRCTARRGLSRFIPVASHLGFTGPARVITATWLNLAGLLLAALFV